MLFARFVMARTVVLPTISRVLTRIRFYYFPTTTILLRLLPRCPVTHNITLYRAAWFFTLWLPTCRMRALPAPIYQFAVLHFNRGLRTYTAVNLYRRFSDVRVV